MPFRFAPFLWKIRNLETAFYNCVKCPFFNTGSGGSWPTGDGLHPLNAYPKRDAQGAAPKVSFAVLYSPVARPGFGLTQALTSPAQASVLKRLADFATNTIMLAFRSPIACKGSAHPVLGGSFLRCECSAVGIGQFRLRVDRRSEAHPKQIPCACRGLRTEWRSPEFLPA